MVERKTKFEDLVLPEKFRKSYYRLQEDADDLYKSGVLLIKHPYNSESYIEESVHFLHDVNSKARKSKRKLDDMINYNIISEMLAFFGCLQLGVERTNPFSSWPDSYTQKEMFQEFKEMNEDVIKDDPIGFMSSLIHQQGYTLGERLFYSYLDGKTSKREISNLFKRNFNMAGSALETFVEMRQKLWPIDKPEWIWEEDKSGGKEEEPELIVIW